MNRRRVSPAILLALIATPLAARVPITNDDSWKKYFSAEELAASEKAVGKLIPRLEKEPANRAAVVAEIAAKGASAIPALVRYCGSREMGLLAGSHGGPVPLPIYHPKCPAANAALFAIRSPEAKPYLFRIQNDSYMGVDAMRTLLEIGGLSAKELTYIIDAPRGQRYRQDPQVAVRLGELPPDDRAPMLIHLLQSHHFYNGAANLVTHGDEEVKDAKSLIDDISAVPSQISLDYLTSAYLGSVT